jgi:hypothetical protein
LGDELEATFHSASSQELIAALPSAVPPGAGDWLQQFLADVTLLQGQLQRQIQAAETILTRPAEGSGDARSVVP